MLDNINNIEVLFVEDDKIAAFIGEELLKNTGFLVDTVTRAEDAIELFKAKPYAIIFMDIELPGMSGSLCAREIRSIEKREHRIPSLIFALTAHTSQANRDHCFEMGMTEVIEKPLNDKKISMAIQMLSEVKKDNQRLSFTNLTNERIEVKELMKLTNNDTQQVKRLIEEFSNFLEKMKKELEDEIKREDKKEFIHSIHTLAATASYIHAPNLCKLTKYIESEEMKSSLQELMPVYTQIVGEIKRIQQTKFDNAILESK